MSAESLLEKLDELGSELGSNRRDSIFSGEVIWTATSITGSIKVHDWRPFWAKVREVQDEFNAKPRFEKREDREAAWSRFQEMCAEGKNLQQWERDEFQAMSQYYRNDIMSSVKPLFYHAYLSPGCTPEERAGMKEMAASLNAVQERLKDWSQKLTKEQRQECWDYIRECRDSHQRFWDNCKEHHQQRRSESRDKAQHNLEANRERLAKAEDALQRQLSHRSDLRDKLSEGGSDSYMDRVSGWLEECEAKIVDIRESISRIEGWIQQDVERLNR